jgi:hypothetical protein
MSSSVPLYSEDKPRLAGLSVSSEGFSSDSRLRPAEWISYSLFLDPLQLPVFNPALHIGLLFPLFPFAAGEAFINAEADITLFTGPVFYAPIFGAYSAYAPALQAAVLIPVDSSQLLYSISFSPLRFKSGDASFGFFQTGFLFDSCLKYSGWRLALFDFSYLTIRKPGNKA